MTRHLKRESQCLKKFMASFLPHFLCKTSENSQMEASYKSQLLSKIWFCLLKGKRSYEGSASGLSKFLNTDTDRVNTYSKKTYVLLHFEHKNDVTIIVKLLIRASVDILDKCRTRRCNMSQ